jgi:hypothetical protein
MRFEVTLGKMLTSFHIFYRKKGFGEQKLGMNIHFAVQKQHSYYYLLFPRNRMCQVMRGAAFSTYFRRKKSQHLRTSSSALAFLSVLVDSARALGSSHILSFAGNELPFIIQQAEREPL